MTVLDDQLSQTAVEEGVAGERALLLWFLRTVLAVEELDAYEFVLERRPETSTDRVDAAYISDPEDASESGILNIVEVRTRSLDLGLHPDPDSGPFATWVSDAVDRVTRILGGDPLNRDFRHIRQALGLNLPRKLDVSRLRIRIHLVLLTRESAAVPPGLPFEVILYNVDQLERVARAVAGPSAIQATVTVPAHSHEILHTTINAGDIVTCPVRAIDIVNWPGIEDRTLFDLNVRFELGAGRVRRSLDDAIKRQSEHGNFLAFHNGLTVVCDRVRLVPHGIEVANISVVNGAQSVIAFDRNRDQLTDDIRVLVKFAAVGATSSVGREIAIRSNTQNPVNSRNLRALDPRQLTLQQEFVDEFPDYVYVLRPDVQGSPGVVRIANDEAAQLLCAVYNERPWLAVKRLILFEPPHYQTIFSPHIRASHIVFCHRLRGRVTAHRHDFPAPYNKAWKLTALVATYLAGQVLRATDNDKALLDEPQAALRSPELDAVLDRAVHQAVSVLEERRSYLKMTNSPDDYKVDFKRETALRELASQARRIATTLAAGPLPA